MDGSPTVRLEAAYSLGMRGANAIPFQEVFTALRGTPALRSERARDIVRHFAPGNAPAIQSMLLRASEWREKVLLLHGMAASGDLSGTELVASLLKDEHARVRVAAIQALVTMGDPTHAPAVLALAADPDPRVRLAVAQYASGLREIDSSTPLETLALDADFDVQRTAIHGLVSLGGPRLASFQSQSGENPLVQALLTEATHALASHSRGGRAP
jgi:HEAT repeat protein